METLCGTYEKTIDSKGRVVIPNEFRTLMDGDNWVLTKWVDKTLALFPSAVWNSLADYVHQLGIDSPEARSARRFILAAAFQVQPDAQGRLIMPTPLREWANIGQDIILTGDWDKVQIWDKATYQRAERGELPVDTGDTRALARAYQFHVNRGKAGAMGSLTGDRLGEGVA